MLPVKVLVGVKPKLFNMLCRQTVGSGFDLSMADLAAVPLAGYDAVLPLSLQDHAALTARRAAGERVPAVLPAPGAVALCNDKLKLNRHLIAAGLAALVPPLLPADAPPPYILKHRRDVSGRQSQIVTTPEQAAALQDRPESHWFRQVLVPGETEHALHVLMHGGRPVFHARMTYRSAAEVYVKGIQSKPVSRQWSAGDDSLAALLPILQAVGFSDGLCCIDFKTLDGRVQMFEVNPRFGASLALQPTAMLAAYWAALAA